VSSVLRVRNLLLVVALAALAFGGSFTCTTSSGDGHVHTDPHK
jgi:hypothetical protein